MRVIEQQLPNAENIWIVIEATPYVSYFKDRLVPINKHKKHLDIFANTIRAHGAFNCVIHKGTVYIKSYVTLEQFYGRQQLYGFKRHRDLPIGYLLEIRRQTKHPVELIKYFIAIDDAGLSVARHILGENRTEYDIADAITIDFGRY